MGAALAAMSTRHGVATGRDLRACGVSARVEARLVRGGVLVRAAPGVVVAAGAPATWRQRAMVATAAVPGSALSHGAAARLHGLAGFLAHADTTLLAPKGCWRRVPAGTSLHLTRAPFGDQVITIDAVPTLNVPTTLVLLAAWAGEDAVRAALRDALRRGVRLDDLDAAVARWRSRGRPGPAVMARLLTEQATPGDDAGRDVRRPRV